MSARPAIELRPLSAKQKTLLAVIAGRAYRRLGRGLGDMTVDEYRRQVAETMVGCRISEAKAKHFDALFVRFKADAGEMDEAWAKAMDKMNNTAATLLWRIRSKLGEADLPDSYAVKIARSKFGAIPGWSGEALEGLTLGQLEQLSWDVDRAVRAMKKRSTAAALLIPATPGMLKVQDSVNAFMEEGDHGAGGALVLCLCLLGFLVLSVLLTKGKGATDA